MMVALQQHGIADTLGRALMERHIDATPRGLIPRAPIVEVCTLPVPSWPWNPYRCEPVFGSLGPSAAAGSGFAVPPPPESTARSGAVRLPRYPTGQEPYSLGTASAAGPYASVEAVNAAVAALAFAGGLEQPYLKAWTAALLLAPIFPTQSPAFLFCCTTGSYGGPADG